MIVALILTTTILISTMMVSTFITIDIIITNGVFTSRVIVNSWLRTIDRIRVLTKDVLAGRHSLNCVPQNYAALLCQAEEKTQCGEPFPVRWRVRYLGFRVRRRRAEIPRVLQHTLFYFTSPEVRNRLPENLRARRGC